MTKSAYDRTPQITLVREELFMPKDMNAWLKKQCAANGNIAMSDLLLHLIAIGLEQTTKEQTAADDAAVKTIDAEVQP